MSGLTRKEAMAKDAAKAKAAAPERIKIEFPKRPREKRALIVDADIVAHQAIDECLEEVHTGDDEWTYRCDVKRAKEMVAQRLRDHAIELSACEILLALGGKTHWRKEVLPSYKSNRSARKPLGYWSLVEWMMSYEGDEIAKCVAKRSPNLEADDIVGVAMTSPKFMPGFTKIAVSEDKDFKQIPGLLFNPRRPEDGVVKITEAQADRFHMTQTLTGDSADGYKGCPGCGPVTAEKVLSGKTDMWACVVAAYEKAGLTEEDALVSARVARILRTEDVTAKGDIKLWTPPKAKGRRK